MTQGFENRQTVLQSLSGETALHRLAALATEFGAEHLAFTTRSIAERVSQGRFYVACVGQFKRGKSTLLNALIGHSVLPTAVVPVTAIPTIIRYGEHLAARLRLQTGTWTDIPVSTIEDFVSEDKNPENAKGVASVEIFVPSPLLATGMCLVDTPGLGSVFAGNTGATHAFIPHIDAAIFVIGADPPLSGDELELVETLSQEVHDLVFVLNKADRTNTSDRSAAMEFARRILETRLKRTLPVVLEVSALDHLEQKGPERDWPRLIHALQDLVRHSGSSLVRAAKERCIRSAASQLLAVIKEERNTLERPLEDSERRIARLRKTLAESEGAMRDLAALLNAEQQRLSGVFVERRNAFVKQEQVNARNELTAHASSLPASRNGPAYRRTVNHAAQEIVRARLTPWLEGEAKFAEEEFRKTAKRFVALANEFLHRLRETGVPGLEELPEDLDSDQRLSARSQFHFHVIERVAAPASPFVFIFDLLFGGIGLRGGIVNDAKEFVDQLLGVNSSRVQSDVDERVRESRKKLEIEIRAILRDASGIVDSALTRARAARAAGTPAIEAALARLHALEREVVELSGYAAIA
jgi:predicted GTPase